jgi:hypothetical protein
VLTCCDMTTSPDGQPVQVQRRLAEIHNRYGPGHLVSRVHPARHADDPPRSRAGPSKSRPDHIAPRIGGGRPMPRVARCGLNLAPGMSLLAYWGDTWGGFLG